MTSTLVKANKPGKSPTQMIRDLRTYDKYCQTPLSRNLASLTKGNLASTPSEASLPTDQELADKAKDLGLIDGLPFTYCLCDQSGYTGSMISLDLRVIEQEYEEIYQICNLLAPHSPTIGTPLYKPHAFRPERKSGLTRLTDLLCRQLGFMHGSVNSIEHALLHDEQLIVSEIMRVADSREKVRLLGKLSRLVYEFRRNYFGDIPFLLEIVTASPEADFFLYNYLLSFDEQDLLADDKVELLATEAPELVEAIRQSGVERERLKAQGINPLENAQNILAKAKQIGTKPLENYFLKQGLSPDQAVIAATIAAERIDSLEADETKLAAFLESNTGTKPAKSVKPDKTAQPNSEAVVKIKNLQPEDFDGAFTKARREFAKISGIEPEEISIKFPGGFATSVF